MNTINNQDQFNQILQQLSDSAEECEARIEAIKNKDWNSRTPEDYLYLVAEAESHLGFYETQGSAWDAWINIGRTLERVFDDVPAIAGDIYPVYRNKYRYELLNGTIGQL
ncbi:MAG: hypothetical protein K0U52_12790 [Gammaproteobacteria bacterium]|nr:hypothetical protein [Gammaproteobacteria bacterium]